MFRICESVICPSWSWVHCALHATSVMPPALGPTQSMRYHTESALWILLRCDHQVSFVSCFVRTVNGRRRGDSSLVLVTYHSDYTCVHSTRRRGSDAFVHARTGSLFLCFKTQDQEEKIKLLEPLFVTCSWAQSMQVESHWVTGSFKLVTVVAHLVWPQQMRPCRLVVTAGPSCLLLAS